MRKLVIGAAAVAALVSAAPANAGCWATATLAPPPEGTAPGEVWVARVTILQHGRHPLPDAVDAKPTLTIRNDAGEKRTFPAKPTERAAVYEAQVVFPSAGTWRYEVFDGFTTWNGESVPCARSHSFTAVDIGGASSAGGPAAAQRPSAADVSQATEARPFPVLAVVVGGLLVLLAAAGVTLVVRRAHTAHPGRLP